MRTCAEDTDVLFVCGHFHPALRAGGGARTLANTVAQLGTQFRLAVVTRNHDVGDSRPFGDPPSNQWVRTENAAIYYAADRDLTLRQLLARIREADPRVIYLNSLFSVLAIRVLLLRRAGLLGGRSVIVAPEGELGKGALATRPLRKQLYLRLARRFGMFRGVLWKAASSPEARLIRGFFGATEPVTIAANLTSAAAGIGPGGAAAGAACRPIARRRRGEVEMIFLSRLSPKKNLLFLLDVLRQVQANVHLGIAGPIEDAPYWRRCEAALARLPPTVRVTRHGALHPDSVSGLLAQFDVFALPTLDENYGYVILEALSAGCRLLLSPHTPWSDVEAEGVGRILELSDPRRWCAEIEALADLPDSDLELGSRRAIAYARRHLASDQPLRELKHLLYNALSRSRIR